MSSDSTSIKTKTTSEKIYSYKSRKINNLEWQQFF